MQKLISYTRDTRSYTFIRIHIYKHAHTDTHTDTHTQTHTHKHICIYIYIYIHTLAGMPTNGHANPQ